LQQLLYPVNLQLHGPMRAVVSGAHAKMIPLSEAARKCTEIFSILN